MTFCIIVGDYGGSMGFTTHPPFCTAYPLSFSDKDDPSKMTFWHPQNQPTFFTADILLVCQLLARDSYPCEYVEGRCLRCLIIPWGLHFSSDLFPQIVIPHDHAAPYRDPQSGAEAPFFTVGPFVSMDMLFPGTAGDLDLFTDEEIFSLTRIGVLKLPITSMSNPHTPLPASRVERDSSTRRQGDKDSPSHWHPVSVAAGSYKDLGKSENKCEVAHKQLYQDIGTECGHAMSKYSAHGHTAGDRHCLVFKCGGSVDTGISSDCPHPKE